MLIDYHEVLMNLSRERIVVSEAFEIYNEQTEQIKRDLQSGINIVNKQIKEIAELKDQIEEYKYMNAHNRGTYEEHTKSLECCGNCGNHDNSGYYTRCSINKNITILSSRGMREKCDKWKKWDSP